MLNPDFIPSLPFDIALDCLLRVPLQAHSTLQQVCRSWKSLLCPSFYQARKRLGYSQQFACLMQTMHPSPMSPGKTPVYAVSIYDAQHKAWERLPPVPDFPDGLPLFCQCVAVGTKLVVLGGWDPTSWAVLKSVYIYDFATGQWRAGCSMPSSRSFFSCASFNGKVLVAGGHDDSKNALRTAVMYDLVKDEWRSLPDMHQERDECKAAHINGKVAVISGFVTESQGQFSGSAEIYDNLTGTWQLVEDMWVAGLPPSSVTAVKGQLYAVMDSKLMRYRSKEEQWETVGLIPKQVRVPACVTALGDRVFLSGYSGGALPYEAFTCDVGAGPCTWQQVEATPAFSGLAQAACTLEV